jgi:membrane-associated phospholipid phosphatase
MGHPGRPHDPITHGEPMNLRFLLTSALIAATLLAVGLLVVDIPLARWIHASGYEGAAVFVQGLGLLDQLVGLRVWYWIAAAILVPIGLLGLIFASRLPLPRGLAPALLAAGLVQAGTIGLMMLGKNLFGRLRPHQLLESGDWSTLWFAGGGSFPSGHASFYFGLFVPLAASAPRVWQRIALMSVPAFVGLARLDMSRHFLSDIAASFLVATLLALLIRPLMRRWQNPP